MLMSEAYSIKDSPLIVLYIKVDVRLCEHALFIHRKYYKVRLPLAPVMGYVRDSFLS